MNKKILESYSEFNPSSGININSGVDVNINDTLQSILSKIQSEYGKPITIVSAKRSSQRNKEVGGAKNSAHLRANAVDIKLPERNKEDTINFINIASKNGIGGIGVYRPGSIHLDVESKRAWGPSFGRSSVPSWAEESIKNHLSSTSQYSPVYSSSASDDSDIDISQIDSGGIDAKDILNVFDSKDDDDLKKYNIWGAFSDAIVDTAKNAANIKEEIDRFNQIMKYKNISLTEESEYDDIVKNSKISKVGNISTVRGMAGDPVFSPLDGIIESIDESICDGLVIIKTKTNLGDDYVQICGVKNLEVYEGQKIYKGDKLGILGGQKIVKVEKKSEKEYKQKKEKDNTKKEKSSKYKYKKSYDPYFKTRDLENLPYTLQALPFTIPMNLVKSGIKTIFNINEDLKKLELEIQNFKKLIK